MTYDPYQQQPQPPQPYSPGPQGWPAAYPPVIVTQQAPSSGMATASMVFGILGILGGWCMLGIPCVLAVIFGHIGLGQTKDGARSGRGQAVAGLIMGYVFVVPAILIFFLAVLGAVVGDDPSVTPSSTP